jgi:hypothetical protein
VGLVIVVDAKARQKHGTGQKSLYSGEDRITALPRFVRIPESHFDQSEASPVCRSLRKTSGR